MADPTPEDWQQVKQGGYGGGKKNAPPPPDFRGAAEAQAAGSGATTAAQTQANRPDQTTPFASSQWRQNPDGSWSQSTGFGGPLGGLSSSLQQQAAGAMGTPFDLSGLPALDSGQAARDQAIQASYGQATSRLDPMWSQREEQQRTRLLNQGLDPASEAYRGAERQLGQQRNDAYQGAMNAAIGQGNEAGQAIFGQSLARRQNALGDMLRQRGQALGELGGLQGFLAMPGFQGAGRAEGAQYLPAALAGGNYAMNAWQGQNQANADMFNGITGLLKAPFSFL